MLVIYAHLLLLHFIGDFLLQTRWQANNKSENIIALTLHVLSYGAFMFIGLLNPILTFASKIHGENLLWFVGINCCLHWVTDLITSQFTKHFHSKENHYGFFAVIGFDQYIHQMCLLFTIRILVP